MAITAAHAQSPSIDERLQQVQQQIDAMHEENRAIRDENRRLKERLDQLERERAGGTQPGQTDDQFRAKVVAVMKEEKPAPFAKPLGRPLALKLGAYIQGQAEFGDVDAWSGRFPNASNRGDDRFKIRRTRIIMSGDFDEQIDFKVMGDFASTDGSANRQSTFAAIDIFANWHRFPELQLKVGQFTAPYGLEQMTPDLTLYAAERSLVSESLTPDRLLGVQVWGWPLARVLAPPHDKLLEYRVGIFNGNGRNRFFNDNESFLYAGRLQINLLQPHTLAYADDARSATNRDARLSFGLDGMLDRRADKDTTLVTLGTGGLLTGGPRVLGDGSLTNAFTFASDYRREAWGADVAARYGPFDLIAEYLETRFTPEKNTARDAAFTARGFYVTAACFLPVPGMERKFQRVEKLDFFEPSNLLARSRIRTLTTGLNCYLRGDDLKLMFDWQHTWSDARHEEFDAVLTRLQLQF